MKADSSAGKYMGLATGMKKCHGRTTLRGENQIAEYGAFHQDFTKNSGVHNQNLRCANMHLKMLHLKGGH